jgi:hypothetical protein
VNPALVLPDKDGKPYTVRYDAINAMLLNEFLKAHRRMEEQEAPLPSSKSKLTRLFRECKKVSDQLELSKPPA